MSSFDTFVAEIRSTLSLSWFFMDPPIGSNLYPGAAEDAVAGLRPYGGFWPGLLRCRHSQPDAKGGWPQRQRPKYRARLRLWRLTKNFQRTLQLRASNEAQRQLAFDIEVTSQRTVPELTGS